MHRISNLLVLCEIGTNLLYILQESKEYQVHLDSRLDGAYFDCNRNLLFYQLLGVVSYSNCGCLGWAFNTCFNQNFRIIIMMDWLL